jgi:hypothetical protein
MIDARQSQRALVIALLASLILWNWPFDGIALYPFKLLATWLHEMSHGLVMLLTGAGFDEMEIFRDTSGLAYADHSMQAPGRAAIAAAGYMGTPIFGALFLVYGHRKGGPRRVLAALGCVMALSVLLFVRNTFGIVVVSIGAGIFITMAMFASENIAAYAVSFLAAQSCVNAVLDIRVLFRENLVVNGEVMGASDAHNMADATFGNAWMWSAIWLAWSLAVLFVALRWLYVRHREAAVVPSDR